MKKILAALLLIFFFTQAKAQTPYTAPWGFNYAAPTAAPSALGTHVRLDISTGRVYQWSPDALNWQLQGYTIEQISGSVAPAYAPVRGQSWLVVNSDTLPRLYQYTGTGTVWKCLNCSGGKTYTAGTGITLSGPNSTVINNAGDLSSTNELNTGFDISGGNLRVIDAGATRTVSLTSIAPIQSVTGGTGITVFGTNALTVTNTGDLSNTNELQNLSLSGQALGISSGTGVTLPVVGVGAGTGISVASTGGNVTVTNTGDLNNTNEIQTLSISGSDLSLSNGGGTVTLPDGGATLRYDNNRLPATYKWHPSLGLAANEYVTNYPPQSVNGVNIKFSTSPFGTSGTDYGGWLANGTSGDSIAVTAPFGVVIGDSQAAGGGGRLSGGVFTPSTQELYGQIAYTLRQLTHMKWYNHGISGQTTVQVWARWRRDVLAQTYNPGDGRGAKTLNRKPGIVVIVAGINDVFTGISPDSTIYYLEKMAKSCQLNEIQCVMLNLPGHLGAAASVYAKIDTINTYMASGALQALGVSVIDYNTWWRNPLYDDNAHAQALISDVVHPYPAGYDTLANIIFRTAKLPILDSVRIYTAISPDGFSGYSRPTSITIQGAIYSIANASEVTTPWTTPMSWDSVYIKIVGSTSVTGTAYSGFNHVEWLYKNDTTDVVTKKNPNYNNYPGRGVFVAGRGIGITETIAGTVITNTGDYNPSDDITGSGTAGQIPVFSTAQVLGNSALYASGGNFGVGVVTPLTHAHIYGTSTSSTYGSIFIQTPQPSIVQQCERASGGAIYSLMKGTLKNTTTGLSTRLYELGVYGDARSGATAPTLNNFYIATKPTGGTNDAALTIDASQNVSLFNTTTIQGAGTTSAETALVVNNSAANPAIVVTCDLNTSVRGKMKVGGAGTPTAYLHLSAGAASASNAPLKFTSGALLTTKETGAIEYDGTNFYSTISTVRAINLRGLQGSATIDFTSIAAGSYQDATITVTGAATTDKGCSVVVPNASVSGGLMFFWWISAADTVTIRCYNSTASPIDPTSGSFSATVIK